MKGTPFGKYELLGKVAAGGMAEVHLAREWGKGGFFRDLVIKRLFDHLTEHAPTLRSFQYEARLMSELCHPNIPQVYDLGTVGKNWYMAMEYVYGMNVADLVRAGMRAGVAMPLHVVLGLVMQVAEALHHAHERKDRAGHPLAIVHRDVTPHNIIVTHDGVAKLIDFGVAQSAANREEPGGVKGTYAYMAPEQVRGRVVDRRADVFSLGVILYELTTMTRLYRGSEVQIMTQIVEQDAPHPSMRVPDYPPDLEEIVLASLRRDPDYRIASAADLALHLEHFAMRHGLLVGPRQTASFVNHVWPTEREHDTSLAMVDVEERPKTLRPSERPLFELEESDLQALESVPAAPPPASESLAVLAAFDEGRVSAPVLLLDQRKAPAVEAVDYMRELHRRLEDEDVP